VGLASFAWGRLGWRNITPRFWFTSLELKMGNTLASVFFISGLTAGYGFLLGMMVAAITGRRGFRFGDSVWESVAYVGYTLASLGTLVSLTTLIIAILTAMG